MFRSKTVIGNQHGHPGLIGKNAGTSFMRLGAAKGKAATMNEHDSSSTRPVRHQNTQVAGRGTKLCVSGNDDFRCPGKRRQIDVVPLIRAFGLRPALGGRQQCRIGLRSQRAFRAKQSFTHIRRKLIAETGRDAH